MPGYKSADVWVRSFSRRLIIWLGAVGLNLVMIALLAVGWGHVVHDQGESARLQASVARSWARNAALEKVASAVQQAENGHRGYLITGDRAYLVRRDQAVGEADAEIARLSTLYAAQPDQLARVADLRRAVDGKFDDMAQTDAIRARRGFDAAARAVAEGQAETLTGTILSIETRMGEAERAHLDRQRIAAVAHDAQATGVARLILVALLTIAAFVVFVTYRIIVRSSTESRLQQAIFNGALDAIVVLDPERRVESVNKAAERMFGYSPDELVGRPLHEITHLEPGEEERIHEQMIASCDGARPTIELNVRRKSGGLVPVDVNVGEMTRAGSLHVVLVMRDCTERKRVERAKDEFVSTVSHELRTPLTSIAGSLGLLAAGAAGPLPERASRLITIAESNSRRLVRLINDILDMEKMQSGKMNFTLKPLDVAELTRRAVDAMSGLGAELDIRFETTAPDQAVTVQGDPDRLTQVLTNLLSNAAKFSPKGGVVAVSVETAGGRARIAVRDHGPGIPPEFHDRIFGKFAQADSSDTRAKSGSGLGLAISRGLVERHGGRIWFESEPGEGATFFVELPLVAPVEANLRTTGPRLLLCEDDPDVTHVLRAALDLQGFRLESASTLREAEEALAEGDFAALLLDLRLPDGNGLDLVRKLRANPKMHGLPVIVISADSKSQETGNLDLVDWIEKPIDMRRLQRSLEKAVDRGGEPPLVLHVDDDPDIRQLVQEAFHGRCRFLAADSVAATRALLATATPQLVILDIGLPDGSGLQLIPELVDDRGRALPVVIFSAEGCEDIDLTDEVDAVLTKSRTSLTQLARTVRRLVREEERKFEETPV